MIDIDVNIDIAHKNNDGEMWKKWTAYVLVTGMANI